MCVHGTGSQSVKVLACSPGYTYLDGESSDELAMFHQLKLDRCNCVIIVGNCALLYFFLHKSSHQGFLLSFESHVIHEVERYCEPVISDPVTPKSTSSLNDYE